MRLWPVLCVLVSLGVFGWSASGAESRPDDQSLDAALDRLAQMGERARKDPSVPGLYALGVEAKADFAILAQHPDEPRVRAALKSLAQAEPRYVHDGEPTFSGRAESLLLEIEGREAFAAVMQGAKGPQERLVRVRGFFKQHPDWLAWNRAPTEQREVVRLLLDAAESDGDGSVADLLAPSGRLSVEYMERYPDEVVAYLRKIGPEQAASMEFVIGRTVAAKNEAYGAVLKDWLREAKSDETLGRLVTALGQRPNGRATLVEALRDDRAVVVKRAAQQLAMRHADAASLEAIQSTLAHWRSQGAKPQDIEYLERTVTQIEQEIKKGKGT